MPKCIARNRWDYTFSMANWLLIIITILGTIFVVILVSMTWHFKHGTAIGKARHFLTLCSRRKKVPVPSINKLLQRDKYPADISLPQLVLTTAPVNTQHRRRQGTPVLVKKGLIVHHSTQSRHNCYQISDPTECSASLEGMDIDSFKYN